MIRSLPALLLALLAACTPRINAECQGDGDCIRGACVDGYCKVVPVPPPPPPDAGPPENTDPCLDGVVTTGETDTDCGGTCAPAHRCTTDQACAADGDCVSLICTSLVCQASVCGDGILSTNEICDDGFTDACGSCSSDCTANGNFAPHTVCTSACNGAVPRQIFAGGMVGCGGSVTWDSRASLCHSTSSVCSAQQWVDRRGSTFPLSSYWTSDALGSGGNDTADCFASTLGSATPCPANEPMRVCSGTLDADSNACAWTDCGLETVAPSQYFGGCIGNTTAGALCCPPASPCAGSVAETFSPFMAGCSGAVARADRATLCTAGCAPCGIDDWMAVQQSLGAQPAHNYWLEQNFTGDAETTGNPVCAAEVTPDETCGARICAVTQPDASTNDCGDRKGCGLREPSRTAWLGGCGGGADNSLAGTLCCCP